MTKEEIEELFTYHPVVGDQALRYAAVRSSAKVLAHTIIENTPASADQTASIRKLRESVMTANAAIALGVPVLLEAKASGAPFMSIISVAAICHEANRQYCLERGDTSQKPWDEAEEWQRSSAINGVGFTLANPDAPASSNHDSWLKEKEEAGWVYGPVKDADAKTHPCCVPYDALPPEQQAKDYLFRGIVLALAPFISLSVSLDNAVTEIADKAAV